jgi:hypothetical protein
MKLRSPIASFRLSLVIVWLCATALYHLSFSQAAGQDIDLSEGKLKIVMYHGVPMESVPPDLRKGFSHGKIILTAKINLDGKFKAEGGGDMLEGHIAKVTDGKLEVIINKASAGSTGSGKVEATVKLNEPITPKGFIGSSVFTIFYFRVIRDVEGK